jgi:Zn-dependent M28 family amino/carboxypeptidase
MIKPRLLLLLLLSFLMISCGESDQRSKPTSKVLKSSPKAHPDSLYQFVKSQVDFGPRVPNTDAHSQAADWLVKKFESYGASVQVQEFDAEVYDGTLVSLKNIIASYNSSAKKRILLAAHWDTRPFADRDSEDTYAKIDGANDGGSGVAVLLELARIINSRTPPTVGVDIILFDGEDWGEHHEESSVATPQGLDSWWCLGSQYWSKNKHQSNYSAFYGILLDMVGAPNAEFLYDSVSQQNAGRILSKVWDIAHANGYQNQFKKQIGFTGIIDDHVFVNQYARIPMIDIIDSQGGTFTPSWHTQNDNLENISKETLQMVANVLLSVLYNE